ncbi:Lar family restriction alleviation protein [Crenobacter sp. SG2305]|uniref:Lar family restriction alleviation protein n=1 Tax=Crenobacter oryzisoli TaxID=3056844 RepID=UPI0025AA6064|nr:Lar family restriction alleviation protein [Crenobacter sp. SG2305]MDN0082378.1 Lar family restriction alleviation protein [Crenobacter sp. SG2305]
MEKKRKAERPAVIGAVLLACPWCGEEPQVRSDDGVEWLVTCQNPACSVQPDSNLFVNREAAIAAWNKRKIAKNFMGTDSNSHDKADSASVFSGLDRAELERLFLEYAELLSTDQLRIVRDLMRELAKKNGHLSN